MPIVHFKATVHPTVLKLTLWNLPTVHFHEPPYPPDLPNGITIDYRIEIKDGHVDICADVKEWEVSKLDWIYNRVSMMIRNLIDLYSFGTGTAFVVTIDSFIDPQGVEKHLAPIDNRLAPLCTFMKRVNGGIDFGKALHLVIQEPGLALAMRDLISGVTYPNTAVIDCARAVEGIRHIIDPNLSKRGNGWGKLQDELNLDRSYREFISNTSTNPRHGDKSYISGTVVTDVTQRAWTIMNRFIEYRLRGSLKLPLSEFPLLK